MLCILEYRGAWSSPSLVRGRVVAWLQVMLQRPLLSSCSREIYAKLSMEGVKKGHWKSGLPAAAVLKGVAVRVGVGASNWRVQHHVRLDPVHTTPHPRCGASGRVENNATSTMSRALLMYFGQNHFTGMRQPHSRFSAAPWAIDLECKVSCSARHLLIQVLLIPLSECGARFYIL